MKTPNFLMPSFLSFGPLFLVIGLGLNLNHGRFGFYFALIGSLMISSSSTALFMKQMRLEKEINELKGSQS